MIETLRPNAAGDECNINSQAAGCSACPNHYDCVYEAIPDDLTTDVHTWGAGYLRDLYNVADSVGAGAINSIKVYAVCKGETTPNQASLKIAIKSGIGSGAPDTPSESGELTITNAWATYNNIWATNPATGAPWTWDEIDKLQIGVSIRACTTYGHTTWCTQVYVEVDYDPPAGAGGSNAAKLVGAGLL